MATKVIGKCFLCKKEITQHDISHKEEGQEYPGALYYEKWPGDKVMCSEHPGVIEQYTHALEEANGKLRKASRG